MKYYEVVRILDVDPIRVCEDEELRFRLEIFRDASMEVFFGKVYRLETYRLSPTYPQMNGLPPDYMNDALMHVLDGSFFLESDVFRTAKDVELKFFEMLSQIATVKDPE